MSNSRGWWTVFLILGLFIAFPTSSFAAKKPKSTICDKKRNSDDRNLCLALNPIRNPESRYKHKDHSTYYCSLIRSRDKQNYCTAVVQGNPKMCDHVVHKKLAKRCRKKSR